MRWTDRRIAWRHVWALVSGMAVGMAVGLAVVWICMQMIQCVQ